MRTISAGRFFDGTTTETGVARGFMLRTIPDRGSAAVGLTSPRGGTECGRSAAPPPTVEDVESGRTGDRETERPSKLDRAPMS
jgi:hypothetical protein